MSDELKPCPFCGATDEVMTTRGFWSGAIPAEAEVANQVGCTVCDIWTPAFGTEEEAIAAWNRRAIPPTATETDKLPPKWADAPTLELGA